MLLKRVASFVIIVQRISYTRGGALEYWRN